jgi:hypothetical protein
MVVCPKGGKDLLLHITAHLNCDWHVSSHARGKYEIKMAEMLRISQQWLKDIPNSHVTH